MWETSYKKEDNKILQEKPLKCFHVHVDTCNRSFIKALLMSNLKKIDVLQHTVSWWYNASTISYKVCILWPGIVQVQVQDF